MQFFHVILLISLLSHEFEGAKVLLIPINVNSHVLDHAHLARALAQEGHATTMLVASNARVPGWLSDDVTILRYQVQGDVPFMNSEESSSACTKIAMAKSALDQFSAVMEFVPKLVEEWNRDCEALFADSDIAKHVVSAKYDLAVSDTSGLLCHGVFPYAFSIPHVNYGIVAYGWIYRVPDLPSFVPGSMASYSDRMTFWERALNTLYYFGTDLALNRSTHYVEKYASHRPVISPVDIYQRALLTFELSDISAWYPKPRMPNVVSMGDLIPQAAKPLQGELKQVMESATKGVIYVSFGSYFDHLPVDIAAAFCDVFSGLEQTVIWKTSHVACAEAGTIITKAWLPQNDLLGHQNMKVFVSHCGLNSLMESIYHAVPILGIPIAHDQPFNARVVEEKGYGLSISMAEVTRDRLRHAIKALLANQDFYVKVREGSELLKNKPEPPGKRASFWVEHVIKYGDKHLRTSAFDLNVLQFVLFDVYLFFSVCTITVVIIVAVFVTCLFRLCKWCCRRKPKTKRD